MNKHIYSLINEDISETMNIVCESSNYTRMKLYVNETIYAFVTVPYKVTRDFYNVFMKYYNWYKNPSSMVTFKTCLMCPIPESLDEFEGNKFGPYTYVVTKLEDRYIYTLKHTGCEHPCIANVKEKLPNGYADFRLLMTENYGHMVGVADVYFGDLKTHEWKRVETDIELTRLFPSKLIIQYVDENDNIRVEIGREVFELDNNYKVTYHGYDDFSIPLPSPSFWRRYGNYMWGYLDNIIIMNPRRREIQLTSGGLIVRIGPTFIRRTHKGKTYTENAKCNIYPKNDICYCINMIKKYDIFSIPLIVI